MSRCLIPNVPRRRGAFTLMELLIATAACAVVLAAICGVFSKAIHLRDDATARTREARVRQHAANIIRNDLRNAWISGRKLAIVLEGSRESQQGGFPGYLKFTTYFIITDPAATNRNAGLLVRAVNRNLLASVEERAPETPLLAGVESMDVEFYDGDSWKQTWNYETDPTLPQAIRVRLQPAEPIGGAANPRVSSRMNKPAPIEIVVPWTTQVSAAATAAAATPAPEQ
jgi:type II secretory pathway pseudopilin PulG